MDDNNYWQQLEHYLSAHSDARFCHGICPECWSNKVEPQLAEFGINVPRVEPSGTT